MAFQKNDLDKKMAETFFINASATHCGMQEMGLEPTRYCYHWHLKPARLPIPPLLQTNNIVSFLPQQVKRKIKKNCFNCMKNLFYFFVKKLLTKEDFCCNINESSRTSDKCGSVGIGRRARLRILWQLCRVGSSPIFRIVKKKDSNEKSFGSFFFRSGSVP